MARLGVRVSFLLGLTAAAAVLAVAAAASGRDGHSLSVNITVTPKARHSQPWCEVQVQVDGEPCFSYDCQSNQVTPLCVQGVKMEAPLREELGEILKDLTEEFRRKLLDIEPKDLRGREPCSLQATMVTQEEASGRSFGSWQFVINGRISLRLDLVKRSWTAGHPGDTQMLEEWEEDKGLNEGLWRTSRGDLKDWLQQAAALWEVPGATAILSASPGTTPDTSGSRSDLQEPWFISLIIFICIILFGIILVTVVAVCRRSGPAAGPDPQELQSLQHLQTPAGGADTGDTSQDLSGW